MKFKETPDCFYFIAEASNENSDLAGQVVWQKALINSKKFFLSNGIVSLEHRHQRRLSDTQILKDARYIIGKPVSVYIDENSVMVEGKLYKSNKFAKIIIELLRRGSNKVKASVGGFSPGIIKAHGKETVVSLLWNDLALTVRPVNNTLQAVRGLRA